MGRLRRTQHIAARTRAGINRSSRAKLFPGSEIMIASLALDVGFKRSADVGSFVPGKSKPAQIFDDGIAELRVRAIAIQVLDTQNHLAVALASTLLCPPESDAMPDMKVTSR